MKDLNIRFVLCLIFLCPLLVAQQPAEVVVGLNGTVRVSPIMARNRSIIVFQSDTHLTEKSDQIVFVLQHKAGARLPSGWVGHVRLMLSDGVVAIIGENGTHQVFKFPERVVPASLQNYQFDKFDVFGIARYGESSPLTEAQIAALAE